MAPLRLPLAHGLCVLMLAGCGPLAVPMVQRLDPEQQRQIDQTWDNVLTPVDRVGRQTLLDVLVIYQLHQAGVDRLHLRSEKDCAAGTVTMDVYYNRAAPGADRFDVSVFNADGALVRYEAYQRHEIETTIEELFDGAPDPQAGEEDPAEAQARRQRHEARLFDLLAATQPAATAPASSDR